MKTLPFVALLLSTSPVWAQRCEPLAVGESFSMDLPDMDSPSGMAMRYALRADSPTSYTLYVNLNFNSYKVHDSPYIEDVSGYRLPEATIVADYRKRMNRCFAKTVLSDGAGRQVRLRLYDAAKDAGNLSVVPPEVDIDLIPETGTSFRFAHRIDSGCRVMTHEVMHLAGLVDEYPAITGIVHNRYVYVFPDRATSPKPSALNASEEGYFGTGLGRKKLRLYPAHVDAIAFPGCQAKNSVYYSCAQYAYTEGRSANVPAICRKGHDWLKGSNR